MLEPAAGVAALVARFDIGPGLAAFLFFARLQAEEWAGGKPRFSPDGRWVALDLPTQPLGADIWAAPTTPEGPDRLVRLTEFQFPARTHAWFDWAPDGHLLVTVDRQEDRLLYFSDARGWLERALR